MRTNVLLLAFALLRVTYAQTPGSPSATLNSGLPNLYYPTAPTIITGVTSTDPRLIPQAGPDTGSGPCPTRTSTIPPCILTSQNNNARQDVNLNEPILSSSNVQTKFGAVSAQFLVDTTGIPLGFTNNPVYAQPLYVYQLTTGQNALFVATLNGEVYAFDADNTSTPTEIWSRDETQSAPHQGLKHNCDTAGGLGSSVANPILYLDFVGVISTPVIDLSNGVIYVVNACVKHDTSQHWYLNVLDLTTGNTHIGSNSPVEIAYSVNASGPPPNWQPSGPQQNFSALSQLQRPSLLLTGNTSGKRSVLVGFGTGVSEGGPMSKAYQGWMFDYDVSTPSSGIALAAPTNPFITQCLATSQDPTTRGHSPDCTSYTFSEPTGSSTSPNPCSDGGGTWMASRGPAAAGGNAFFVSGNGGFQWCGEAYGCTEWCTYNPPIPGSGTNLTAAQQFTDFSESVMKIDMTSVWNASPTSTQPAAFWPSDYFLPSTLPGSVPDPLNCGANGTSSCTYFQVLTQNDWDMGIFGVVLFDDCYYDSGTGGTNCTTSMSLAGSKRGDAYAMLQSSLGQYQTSDGDVATSYLNPGSPNSNCTRMINGISQPQCDEIRSVAYWKPSNMPTGTTPPGGFLVAWPWSESLSSYQWSYVTALSQYNLVHASTMSINPWGTTPALFPGGTLSMTVNVSEGTCGSSAAAVVWATGAPTPNPQGSCGILNSRNCTGYLAAYKLDVGSTCTSGALTQIWPSSLPATPDFLKAPYAIPTIVNGRAYVPTYGLHDSVNNNYDRSGIQVYACLNANCQ